MTPADSEPLVDVGIPAYERPRYIVETIESVLAQTMPRWRLTISDDGPGGGAVQQAIAPYLPDRRIRYGATGALRSLAQRIRRLDLDIRELDRRLRELLRSAAPRLLAEPGVGPESAAKLLIIAGDNADRLRSDAALAAICGASPIEASTGKTRRHRLNRGGDRNGNNALWTIANNRMLHHPETRSYAARRASDGLSRKETRRCLMRHLARRLYPLLLADLTEANASHLT